MRKTLVVFASRYGCTELVARQMALVLGPASLCRPNEVTPDQQGCAFVVIGSPVYREGLEQEIVTFVQDHAGWLRQTRVALFCTCLAPTAGRKYLDALREPLGDAIVWAEPIGGRMSLSALRPQDRSDLSGFCKRTGFPVQSVDLLQPAEIVRHALNMKGLRDEDLPAPPRAALLHQIECFLNAHNTCTLCTGAGERVRATPIEYSYHAGHLLLLSEGGEKFANLLLNPRVSVAVYDPYQGMHALAGLQISGIATILEPGSEAYREVLRLKGLSEEKLAGLPVALNAIDIWLERAEFLWSGQTPLGFDVHQTYEW